MPKQNDKHHPKHGCRLPPNRALVTLVDIGLLCCVNMTLFNHERFVRK